MPTMQFVRSLTTSSKKTLGQRAPTIAKTTAERHLPSRDIAALESVRTSGLFSVQASLQRLRAAKKAGKLD